ncbi:hypothetical protein C8R47DRAFT_249120 [Mycena vitilis]|nr:hypothetical protein C8R47DRAFT_249120 [Mycena vitilis]
MPDNAPSPSGSSASDGSASTGPPCTPPSTTLPFVMPTFMNFTRDDTIDGAIGAKRTCKTRRVSTAERRATHNAVERQRRDALNGRFLDLAALLSNLNQIRRPSKSAIVNSSIAHLNASRRHRILSAQQLRMMKNEADALRHEVNEWRARAGVAFVEEPMRGDAFGIVLRGELEFEAGDMLEGDLGDDDEDAAGMYSGPQLPLEPEEHKLLQRQHHKRNAPNHEMQQLPFPHDVHPPTPARAFHSQGYPAPTQYPDYYTTSPTIPGPGFAAFDDPATGVIYEHAAHPAMQGPKWAQQAQQHMLHAHYHQQQQQQGRW